MLVEQCSDSVTEVEGSESGKKTETSDDGRGDSSTLNDDKTMEATFNISSSIIFCHLPSPNEISTNTEADDTISHKMKILPLILWRLSEIFLSNALLL